MSMERDIGVEEINVLKEINSVCENSNRPCSYERLVQFSERVYRANVRLGLSDFDLDCSLRKLKETGNITFGERKNDNGDFEIFCILPTHKGFGFHL